MQNLKPFQGWRLTFFEAIVFAIFVLFGVQLFVYQVVDNETFQIAADGNRLSELPISAPRGTIVDRYNRPLALNVPAYNITIVPAELPSSEAETLEIYNRISALTGVPPTDAVAIGSTADTQRSIESYVDEVVGIFPYRPVVVAQDVPREAAMQILEEIYTLPGVGVETPSVREYPTGAATSQIIGYMGPIPAEQQLELIELGYNPAYDRTGYSGLEYSMETILMGQRGRQVTEVDVAGRPIELLVNDPPVAGYNVRTTIDTELQLAAEEALRNRISELNATEGYIRSETGVVIAMNPQTGEILALVSYPSYDNARFARNIDVQYYLQVANDPLLPLVNHATQSIYPPGSIWKMVTALGVLQEDVIDPRTTLYDGGDLILPNRYAPNDVSASQRFVCWLRSGHQNINLFGAIAQSCDVYFYQVGGGNPDIPANTLREGGLGITDLYRYATALGIGSRLGIELPFENTGVMPDPDWKRRLHGENWSTGDTYNAAFGQGYVNVTPLQQLAFVAAIANGGRMIQPTVVRDISDINGDIVQSFEPEIIRDLNLELTDPAEPIRLLMFEDMIMRGANSLACMCESQSDSYSPSRCNPETYTSQVDINSDPNLNEWRTYNVSVPDNYTFSDNICQPLRFNPNYAPPFISSENFAIAQEGMRLTVQIGTATTAALPYVNVAGKTGTAEYCDEIANQRGLCVPGLWPSHAWFTSYAPYENPEIAIITFIYNGGEGSAVALPVAVETMEAYFRLRNQRQDAGILDLTLDNLPADENIVSTPVTIPLETPTSAPQSTVELTPVNAP